MKKRGAGPKGRKRRLTAHQRGVITRIRTLSHQAAYARLHGNIEQAARYERQKEFNWTIAEAERITGPASRAEESGQFLAERSYRRNQHR